MVTQRPGGTPCWRPPRTGRSTPCANRPAPPPARARSPFTRHPAVGHSAPRRLAPGLRTAPVPVRRIRPRAATDAQRGAPGTLEVLGSLGAAVAPGARGAAAATGAAGEAGPRSLPTAVTSARDPHQSTGRAHTYPAQQRAA